MKTSVELSNEVQDWIRLAGLSVTQGSQTDDGRPIIWNKGGEIRYFVGVTDGYFVLTSSHRMGAENLHLAAVSTAILERYLVGHFGGSVRKSCGLQRVRKPFYRDELKSTYHLGAINFSGREEDALMESTGSVLAIAAVDRLVELSHYIDVTIDTIKDSFLDPEGRPLFAQPY
ncbi:TNT antitoxin family protein [Mycobacterium spongiae]|uniref:Uncharacterized protein n=1 Tax=Mycobacterium spongiae TaxID=886343 RepID=A0A975PXM5_9MYCO|nr:TNT antitoxin family protein [Mycobacterium spongiae]QUR67918.1 hypothetical protein F6B93_13120 [Mycobacterium spongiae]